MHPPDLPSSLQISLPGCKAAVSLGLFTFLFLNNRPSQCLSSFTNDCFLAPSSCCLQLSVNCQANFSWPLKPTRCRSFIVQWPVSGLNLLLRFRSRNKVMRPELATWVYVLKLAQSLKFGVFLLEKNRVQWKYGSGSGWSNGGRYWLI